MICISVSPESRKLAKVDLLNAARQADLVELCLDKLIKEPDVGDLVHAISKPILVSCRRPQDGGHFQGTDAERMQLLRQAIVAGPAYVELDLEIAGSIPRFGQTKRVISCSEPPAALDELMTAMQAAKADVIKLGWPAHTFDAVWPLLKILARKGQVPMVGAPVGRAALTFSVLARKLGVPWVYAALEDGMQAYPGQPTAHELLEVYDTNAVSPETSLLGLVGIDRKDETLPRLFNSACRQLGVGTRCVPLEFQSADRLPQRLDALGIRNLLVSPTGCSIAVDLAEQAEEAVEQSGCADLLVKRSGAWNAYNMIWRAALQQIENVLGKTPDNEKPLDKKTTLLLGSGNLARCVGYGLARRKGVLNVCSPNDVQARELARIVNGRHIPFANLYDTYTDVLIVADPGLSLGHKKSEFNAAYIRPHMLVADVSRLPEESELLRDAKSRGAKTVSAQSVFATHMSACFKAVTGRDLPPEYLTGAVGE